MNTTWTLSPSLSRFSKTHFARQILDLVKQLHQRPDAQAIHKKAMRAAQRELLMELRQAQQLFNHSPLLPLELFDLHDMVDNLLSHAALNRLLDGDVSRPVTQGQIKLVREAARALRREMSVLVAYPKSGTAPAGIYKDKRCHIGAVLMFRSLRAHYATDEVGILAYRAQVRDYAIGHKITDRRGFLRACDAQ